MMRTYHRHEDPIAEAFRPRIPPGVYDAICYKTEIGTKWGRQAIYILFRIPDGDYQGIELFMQCNFPKLKLNLNHKYYHQWMVANGGPPQKGQRMARKVFLGKMYRVLVRDTNRKYPDGTQMPSCTRYSVVERIVETITGIRKFE